MQNDRIFRKTAFSDWHEVDISEAKDYAKFKFNQITMGESDNEILAMVNAHFRGVTFTLDELAR